MTTTYTAATPSHRSSVSVRVPSTSSSSSSNVTQRILTTSLLPIAATSLIAFASTFAYRQYQHRYGYGRNPLLSLTTQQQIQHLRDIYPSLVDEFIDHARSEYDLTHTNCERLKKMFDYNIIGGKYNRACLLLSTVSIMCRHSNGRINIATLWRQSLVAAWCVEILQALFLVADDMMDRSITRRGQPCWYRQNDVQYDAINDTLILESFMFFLLNTYFGGMNSSSNGKSSTKHCHHVELMQLYQSTSEATQLGQMLDLLSQPQGIKDPHALLGGFSLSLHRRIVTYKTAIYSFELPIQAGLLICNSGTDTLSRSIVHRVSVELGVKFQIEDDFLDCFQDAEILGKIGTDIKDHKCSWLVCQALRLIQGEVSEATGSVIPSQQREKWKKTLYEHYGKDSDESEASIKRLYREMQLDRIYEKYEDESYASIVRLTQQHSSKLPPELFIPILKKIHKRQK